MIEGRVADLQGRIEVVLRFADQPDRTIECVLDTGFQGGLALPPPTVAALGLPTRGHVWANLADDSDVPIPLFRAVILWDDEEVGVSVMAMGRRPLLGTELQRGFNLSADFEEDGELVLTPL